MALGKPTRFATSLSPLVGTFVRISVWGRPLPLSGSVPLEVGAVRGVGAGLLIYLRDAPGSRAILLKVAQPRSLSLGQGVVEIREAAYVSWAGTKLARTTGEPALAILVDDSRTRPEQGCNGVVDRLFSDPSLAALYDAFGAGRRDFGFYLPMVAAARSVLDVGCGTGALLHAAREAGHTGRLCGLDPAEGMLHQARHRSDVEWVLGDLTGVAWDQEFDLVLMTGHAFQVFTGDDEIRSALAAMRAALVHGGRLAFETRNPLVRAWETWTPDHAVEIVDRTGAVVRMAHEVNAVAGELVSFTTTYSSPRWERPKRSRSTLRFLDRRSLSLFLSEAGFSIEEQYGDWDRRQLTDTSPEIITIARRWE